MFNNNQTWILTRVFLNYKAQSLKSFSCGMLAKISLNYKTSFIILKGVWKPALSYIACRSNSSYENLSLGNHQIFLYKLVHYSVIYNKDYK